MISGPVDPWTAGLLVLASLLIFRLRKLRKTQRLTGPDSTPRTTPTVVTSAPKWPAFRFPITC